MPHPSPLSRRPPAARRRGFTIIELLVATAITLVLAGLLVRVTSGILSLWTRSSGGLTAENQAKLVLDQLATDLQGLLLRRDGNVWLLATIQADQSGVNSGRGDCNVTTASWVATGGGTIKPTLAADSAAQPSLLLEPADITPNIDPANFSISDLRFGQAGVWLRFFTTEADSNAGYAYTSAPRAVAYQIVRLPPSSDSAAANDPRWILLRSSVRGGPTSSTTIAANRHTIGVGFDLSGNNAYNNAGGTNTGDPEPGGLRRPDRNQVLANNVIDFGLRIYTRNATGGLDLAFPTNADFSSRRYAFLATSDAAKGPPTALFAAPAGFNATTDVARGMPAVVEVFLRVATDEGARLLQNIEAGRVPRPADYATDADFWWGTAIANSRTFTQRIEIKPQPL